MLIVGSLSVVHLSQDTSLTNKYFKLVKINIVVVFFEFRELFSSMKALPANRDIQNSVTQ